MPGRSASKTKCPAAPVCPSYDSGPRLFRDTASGFDCAAAKWIEQVADEPRGRAATPDAFLGYRRTHRLHRRDRSSIRINGQGRRPQAMPRGDRVVETNRAGQRSSSRSLRLATNNPAAVVVDSRRASISSCSAYAAPSAWRNVFRHHGTGRTCRQHGWRNSTSRGAYSRRCPSNPSRGWAAASRSM